MPKVNFSSEMKNWSIRDRFYFSWTFRCCFWGASMDKVVVMNEFTFLRDTLRDAQAGLEWASTKINKEIFVRISLGVHWITKFDSAKFLWMKNKKELSSDLMTLQNFLFSSCVRWKWFFRIFVSCEWIWYGQVQVRWWFFDSWFWDFLNEEVNFRIIYIFLD